MAKQIVIVPLDFEKGSTNPRDRILFDAAQKFCKEQFGSEYPFHTLSKNWCVVEQSDEADGYEVIGVSGLAWMPDCPVFHVKPGTDKESWKQAGDISAALVKRMASYLQDSMGVGTQVLIHIQPAAERIWSRFLRRIGAKPANRYKLSV